MSPAGTNASLGCDDNAEPGEGDWIVFAPGSDVELLQGNGGTCRPRCSLERLDQLESFLGQCMASSVTYVAPWRDLTVRVMRQLAEWAAESHWRGCGVIADEIRDGFGGYVQSERDCQCQVAIFSASGYRLLEERGQRRQSESSLLALLRSLRPPSATVVCGHGAEFCIGLGERWLSTIRSADLPGPVIGPEEVASPAVFLNTCSAMRLGDSVVPQGASLAAAFAARGTAVIGSYRNLTPSDASANDLYAGLRAGMSLGQTTNMLNRRYMYRMSEPAPFMLLGDATRAVTMGDGQSGIARETFASLDHVSFVEELGWWAELHQQISRWNLSLPEAESAFVPLCTVADLVFRGADPAVWDALTDEERQSLLTASTRTVAEYRSALSRDLSDWIRNQGWLQSAYAPYSKRNVVDTKECPRCGERLLHYEYLHWGLRGDCVSSEECDRCGTVAEWVGRPPASRHLSVSVIQDALIVNAGCPPTEGTCVLLMHRANNSPVYPWPSSGELRIARCDWPFRGRITLVALVLDQGGISLRYANAFLPT